MNSKGIDMTLKQANSTSKTKRKVNRQKAKSKKVRRKTSKAVSTQLANQEDESHQELSESTEVIVRVPEILGGDTAFSLVEEIRPDWISQTAERMLNEGSKHRYLSRSMPPLVNRYYQFRVNSMRVLENISSPRDADRAMAHIDPECYAAYRIYDQPNAGLRLAIEARLLAGQTNDEISLLTAIPPRVIQLFSDLYFNVRPRLKARDWVCHEVLGSVFQSGDSQWQPSLTTKYFAYFGGPIILDAVMYGNDLSQLPCTNPDDAKFWLDQATRFRIRIQNMIAVTAYQPNRFDVTDLISGYVALTSLELRERDLGGDDNVLVKILDVVKMQNPILLGDSAKFTQEADGMYASKGVVPRVHERLPLRQGDVPDTLAKYSSPDFERPLNGDLARKPSKANKSADD